MKMSSSINGAQHDASAIVNIITQIVKFDSQRGRCQLNFVVSPKDKSDTFKNQGLTGIDIDGACSPDVELLLTDQRCDVQFVISGALGPITSLEHGEDTITFTTIFGGAKQKPISLKAMSDTESHGTTTIKFKVNGRVEHTAHIFDIFYQEDLHSSFSSTDSVNVGGRNRTEYNSSKLHSPHTRPTYRKSSRTQCDSPTRHTDDALASKGTENVRLSANKNSFSNPCLISQEHSPTANPVSPDGNQESQNNQETDIKIQNNLDCFKGQLNLNQESGSDNDCDDIGDRNAPVLGERPEAAFSYSKVISDKSLATLASALDVNQAYMLLTFLSVPTETQRQHQRNHPHDVVSGVYESLRHWRNQKTHGEDNDALNKQLFEELLSELTQINRNDIVCVLKNVQRQNRTLLKTDFSLT